MHYFSFDEFISLDHDFYCDECMVIIVNKSEESVIIKKILERYRYDSDKITILN